MNYIYDIYLNLQDVPFDFFEWNKSDKIIRVKKIPIYRTYTHTLEKLIKNKIKISKIFLNSVHNKTELWNTDENIEFCALFCDNNNIIAINFNNLGISIKKSFLLIDEELEILESVKRYRELEVEFNIEKKEKIIFKTRKQVKEKKFIENELINIEKNKLDYIYFECFGHEEKNREKIINNIKKLSSNSKIYKKLYDILKLTAGT